MILQSNIYLRKTISCRYNLPTISVDLINCQIFTYNYDEVYFCKNKADLNFIKPLNDTNYNMNCSNLT